MKFIYSLIFYLLSGFLLYGQGSPACKTIYIGHGNAAPGEQVCLDVKVKDFQEMLGAQFTMQWDTAMLEYAGLENFNLPDLLPSNFGTTPELLAQGKLPFLWLYINLSEGGYSIPDDEAIFTVCFEVKGPAGSFAPVYFSQSPTPTELTGWPGPQAFENFLTISGGVFMEDALTSTPLELLSSCSFGNTCDSIYTYSAQVSGGTLPYAYQWRYNDSLFANTPDISVWADGKYQLVVTDANGQALFVDFSSASKSLNIQATVTDTPCGQNTGAIDLEVIGGSGTYDYLWSDNSAASSRTDLGAGTYGLTVTDQVSGCAFARQFVVLSDSCETDKAALLIPFGMIEPNGGSACLDVYATKLPPVKGYDISFNWDSSIVQLDNVILLDSEGDNYEVIDYNEGRNSFSFSSRFDEAVTYEEDATLFLACFTSKAEGGFSDVQFNELETQIVLENDSLVTPGLENGRLYIRSEENLNIKIETAGANPEDTVCLAVTSENFTELTNLHYSLTWDNTILEFQGIQSGIFPTVDSSSFINWSVNNGQGVLSFSGIYPEGKTIADDEVHFSMCFTARRGGVGEVIAASQPYTVGASNILDQFVPVNIVPGLVNIGEVPPQAMIKVGENRGIVGEEICVPFTGEQFEGVRKMDVSMSWDTTIIQLSTINGSSLPEFRLLNWEIDHEANGELSLYWENDTMPVSFYRPQVLLELCFMGVQAGISPVSIGQDYVFESDNPSPDPLFLDGQIAVEDQDSTRERILLNIPHQVAAEGQSICVPVYALGFTDIAGMQYAHHWDPSVLRLDTISMGDLPQLSLNNFGFSLGEGGLGFSWAYSKPSEPVSLPDSSILYSLCFTVIGEVGDTSAVWIDGNPIPTEVVRAEGNDLTVIGLDAIAGSVSISRNFVWPGDTDRNGIANHQDLLNIGLAYGQAGPARSLEVNRGWEPLVASDWGDVTPQTLINYKHIDADGDGLISAADTLAITENWGRTTPWYEAPEEEGIVQLEPQQGAPLFVEARGEVKTGKNTFDVILGTDANPAEEVYGLAFSISYDYEGIQSDKVYAGFDSTWLGTIGDNLLTIQRNNPEHNRIDIAITRTDGQNMSGRGAIASLHVTIEDIILFQGNDELIVFEIENVRLIDALEVDQPTAPTPSSMVVSQQTTPTNSLLDERYIRVFPVPAKDRLNIDAQGITPERMSVMSPQGAVLIQRTFDTILELGDLEAGLYFLKLEAQGQAVIKPFIIIN